MIHYQRIPDADRKQAAILKDYCFKRKWDSLESSTFHYWFKKSIALGAYDNEKLVSQYLIIPFQMNVFGTTYDMGGVASVCTYPEYREKGITKQLLLQSLEEMRNNKQSISILSPFAISFYRHFGWELFFENTRYQISSRELSVRNRVDGNVVRFNYNSPDEQILMEKVRTFHKEEVSKRHGNQYRDKMWWERIKERNPEANYAISLDESEQVDGYVRYEVQEQEFQVNDLFAANHVAERKLWQFIQAHGSQVTTIIGESPATDSFGYLFTNPEINRKMFFDKMVRIVDVEAFLKQYPFQTIEEPLYVKIEDEQAEWNQAIFKIEGQNKVEKVGEVEANQLLEMEIGPFSAMMLGYHPLEWYCKNGRAFAEEALISIWEQAIPRVYPTHHDGF